eukprot:gnl/MRDRNA2_/MRDRNA2_256662_c0_seq1.p3 gnl/MRDRNA2_/MRDRNA2_256662_c0~~gnl/MRDRNA2_/MRDRNA2_256662_c0_seq1.p3  ORF type:complete len:118 (-),score=0.87 gnl/MRDRNA2_/MRDRNA2_256662_c0_seq1:113-466(-)
MAIYESISTEACAQVQHAAKGGEATRQAPTTGKPNKAKRPTRRHRGPGKGEATTGEPSEGNQARLQPNAATTTNKTGINNFVNTTGFTRLRKTTLGMFELSLGVLTTLRHKACTTRS